MHPPAYWPPRGRRFASTLRPGRSMKRFLAIFLLAMIAPQVTRADDATGPAVDYSTQIKPILIARCYACHSALRKKSGLRVDTAAELISGGDAGPAIVPGKSNESY